MNKTISIYVRVTPKEKADMIRKAKKCGLSLSEYLRKRALGYEPRALLPDSFYELNTKLGTIYESTDDKSIRESILSILDKMRTVMLSPGKE